MAVQTEDFRLTHEAPHLSDALVARTAAISEAGFNPSHQTFNQRLEAALAIAPQLTGFDLAIWQQFLPTSYSRKRKQWDNYRFDEVPEEALEAISFARSLEVFDDLEIWTPERGANAGSRQYDPMLVGVVGTRADSRRSQEPQPLHAFFQLFRWGESLLPFDEIVKQVFARRVSSSYGDLDQLPPGLANYLQSKFRANPHSYTSISRAWVRRHCGERLYQDYPTTICGVCGLVRTPKRAQAAIAQ